MWKRRWLSKWSSGQFCRLISSIFILGLSLVSCLECEYYNVTECTLKEDGTCDQTPRTITCEPDEPAKVHSCFVLWQRLNNTDHDTVQYKGCFLNDKLCNGKDTCIDLSHGKNVKKAHTLYCCCTKDLCNQDYSWDPASTTTVKPKAVTFPRQSSSFSIVLFVIIPLGCALCIVALCFFYRRMWQKQIPDSSSGVPDEENILLDKPDLPHAPSVTLVEVKASGRFGNVWKASLAGVDSYVAVKIISLRERASWKLEQEVYALPLMKDNEWILRFMEARNPSDGDIHQFWLISEYLEHGSLYDYLKGNVLTWSELLKIAVTMCQGLAFLHEEIDGGSKGHKPAVAHRDFKSKNVLLRPDLTACIADFGLAHIFYPSKPVGTCHGQVGTRRYMAPEVLEGAVSFTRDNFQRIDMYACGLVLWELASRCSAQKGPVGEYRLPFEEYIGQQPTLDEMQDVVVTKRKRPTIRNDWLSHPGMAVLSEVLKDSWDQDAEARISASCIVERLSAVSNKLTVVV